MATHRSSGEQRSGALGDRLRVLVVEDNSGDARLIAEWLSGGGLQFDVTAVSRLAAARQALAEGGIDCLVLDLGLPDADGLEGVVGAREAAPDVPVVVLTGRDEEDLAIGALEGGAQDYLIKGRVDGESLSRSVRYAVERQRSASGRHPFSDSNPDSPVSTLLDSHGEPIAAPAVTTDVAKASQAVSALRVSEARLRALVDGVPDMMLRVAGDGTYVDFKPAAEFDPFLRPEEFLGRTIEELMPENIAEEAGRQIRRALATGRVQHWEYVLLVGGDTREYEARLVPVEGQNEVVAIIRDVTKRRRAERALRESEELHRGLFEGVPVGVMRAGPSGDILDANPAVADMLGHSDVESLQVGGLESLYAEPADMKSMLVALEDDGTFSSDVRFRRVDGESIWVRTNARTVRDADGEILYYECACEDITERKRTEEALIRSAEELERHAADLEATNTELARANADLGQFAHAVSHDLSEPLRTVSSYIQLLTRRYTGELDTEADEFIDFIVQGVERMQALLEDLMTYARAGTGESPATLIDCRALVGETLAIMHPKVDEAGAIVEVGPLPTLRGNEAELGQVFQNLLSNAIKFSAPDVVPRIEISAQPRGGMWEFAVRDNGIGIEPEHSERIFQMFKRLHSRAAYPGTGAGLAICRKIVERQGGRIWVESTPEGGSTFFFTLPGRDLGD